MKRVWGKNYLGEIIEIARSKKDYIPRNVVVERSDWLEACKLLNEMEMKNFETNPIEYIKVEVPEAIQAIIDCQRSINANMHKIICGLKKQPKLNKFDSPELKNLKNPE